MRKLALLGLSAALMAGSVAVAQDDLASVDPSGQTVVYWHQFSEAQGEAMAAIIENFNATNEWGITVEPIHQGSYGDVAEQMNAAIISGELPNLVAGYQNNAASYANDGVVVDLNTYINDPTWGLSAEQLADIKPALLEANTFNYEPFNGAVLAFPHQNSAQVMAVNMTMLGELGFDAPPTTLEEFREIACAAAELTGPNGEDIFGFPIGDDASVFETFVAAQGGNIYHDGAYDFSSEAVINTLQMYQDMYNEGCAYIPDRPFGNSGDFALGLNPMTPTSTAGFTFILSDFASSGVGAEWVVAPFPSTEGNQTVQVFLPSIILVQSTPEAQLASWLFLKHLATAEVGAQWASSTGYFSPVLSSSELLTEENFVNADMFPYYIAANELQTDETIKTYVSPNLSSYGNVRTALAEAIAAVTTGGEDVATVAARLQEQADTALADSMS